LSHPPTWRERRRDAIETWYRSAAMWRGEDRAVRSLLYGALAVIAAPVYTFRRAYRQRLGARVNR
jgi:hypothetical protein